MRRLIRNTPAIILQLAFVSPLLVTNLAKGIEEGANLAALVESSVDQLCTRVEQGDPNALAEALALIDTLPIDQIKDRRALRRVIARIEYAALTKEELDLGEVGINAIEAIERRLELSCAGHGESALSLICLAEIHPKKDEGLRIANELLQRFDASNLVRQRAMALVLRHNLIGRKIEEIWPQSVDGALPRKANGLKYVIYGWRAESSLSQRQLLHSLSAHSHRTKFIGVNLDSDQGQVTMYAKREQLPGEQITSNASLVAARLGMSTETVIICVNGQGIITYAGDYFSAETKYLE